MAIGATISLALSASALRTASNRADGTKTASPTAGSETPIPTSAPEAKAYIARASAKAASGDYKAAEAILNEAISLFPNDINLRLTLEYYERQDPTFTR